MASLVSDGGVALLEVRGLPIFIAGATAIILFSLLRTGRRGGDRRSMAMSILIGFIVLVAAVAFIFRPSVMAPAQQRLDQTLGVFGPHVSEAVDRFTADVDQWNAEVDRYKVEHLTALDKARGEATDPVKLAAAEEKFRVDASKSEDALDGIRNRMHSHADAIDHAPLRAAVRDLAAVYDDELSGVHLITRGFANKDQSLIASGDTRFKAATARAVELFTERVKPILQRGDVNPERLETALAQLSG